MGIGLYFAAKNIYEAAVPFHFLAKPFGLSSYSVDGWGCNIQTTLFDQIILTGSLFFWIVIEGHEVLRSSHAGDNGNFQGSKFLSSIQIVSLIIQVILSIFVIIYNHSKRQSISELMKALNDFDQKLKLENWSIQIKNSRNYFVPIVAFVILETILSLQLQLFIPISGYGFFEIILETLNNLIFLVVACQFILAVAATTQRMKALYANTR